MDANAMASSGRRVARRGIDGLLVIPVVQVVKLRLPVLGEQLRQAVCEFGQPVQSRPVAGDAESVAATPECGLNGMELSPTLSAFAVEIRGLGEDVQSAVDSLAQVVSLQQRQRAM
jgi:hypothetical protein